MNNRIKIAIGAGAVLCLVSVAVYLKKQDERANHGKTNTIQSIEKVIADKTFKTKTEAYDALVNDKEAFYNRSASAFTVPASVRIEKPQEQTQTQSQPTIQDAQFDLALEAVAQNSRNIYQNSHEIEADNGEQQRQQFQQQQQPLAKAQPQETPEERRRRAMLHEWGMNKAEKSSEVVTANTTFKAVIHGTQNIKAGQTALFRTKETIHYNNFEVPANTLLSGVASVSENRLVIKIGSVRINRDVYALPLEVFGSDGIAGIPLNYDQAGQIADKQVSATAIQEASSAISQFGGAIGRVAGSVISGVGGQVKNAKSIEVKLIDNQSIILKIAKQ